MQAFLFAAGYGVRLRPLTDIRPKVMVPVWGKPVIEHSIERLHDFGIDSYIINTHYRARQLHDSIGDGSKWGIDIRYSHEPAILETGGGLKNAEELIESDTIIVHNGDILCDVNIHDVIRFHKQHKALATLVCASWCAPRQISIDSQGLIYDIRNTFSPMQPTHTFLGIHIIERSLLEHMEPGEKFSIIKTYLKLIEDKQPIFAYPLQKGYWYDIGSIEAYKKAHAGLSALLGSGEYKEPALNGIETDGYLSLGQRCTIGDSCTIRNTILWDDVHIEPDSELDDVIVTDGQRVKGRHAHAIIS